jgi:REP element-mobilizing transposase RayT
MRKPRCLAQGAWYEVRTSINNREPLFQDQWRAAALLLRVLREVKEMFTFEMRGFALEGELLSFYIRPADGFMLPRIMQWLKQTFAMRFNLRDGRTGHIWGDRYWSEMLEGEPPAGAAAVNWKAVEAAAKRGLSLLGGKGGENPLFAQNPPPGCLSPRLTHGKASP